ncbi:MAG: tetratricopeptide repeat protein [Candidatus Rifleibacteriota bacterium]
MRMIKTITIILIFCLTGFSLPAQNLIPELVNQGLKLYAAKDYSGAADYLGQVIDMDPNQDQARYYLVFSLSMSGQLEKSLLHARKLAEKFPQQKQYTDLVVQLEKAIAGEQKKKEQQRTSQAIPKEVVLGGYETKDVMREAKMSETPREIAPPKELTRLDKAILLIDEEYYASASAELDEILKAEPKNAKAMHYKGVMKFNSGLFNEAKPWFEKAINLDPKSFQSFFLLGDCYRTEDNYEKAAEQFKKAIEIKNDVFAQINLADCYIKQNKLKEAEKILTEVFNKDSNIADAALGLAQIKLFGGFTNDAVEIVNKVLARESENAEAHYVKAQILLEGELFEDAADEARRALESFPNNLKYKALYALTLVRAYKVPQGLEEAGKIVGQFPDNIDARLTLAEGLIISGAYSDAEEHMKVVEKAGPHPGVARLRALKATRNGENDKAGEHFKTFMELSAGRPKPYMDYAAWLESVNNNSDALVAYQEIAELFKETAYAETANTRIEQLEQKIADEKGVKKDGNSQNYRKGKVKF